MALPTKEEMMPRRLHKSLNADHHHQYQQHHHHHYGEREPVKKSRGAQKLGTQRLLILLVGDALLVACVSLLVFLWFAPASNPTWSSIVFSGWASRFVTVLSLGIRAVVSAQAVVCSSMLAALVLERARVPFPKMAAMSVFRFRSSGIADLPHFWHLGLPHLGTGGWLLSFVALVMLLISVGLQFTSTALLSDFGIRYVTVQRFEPALLYGNREEILSGNYTFGITSQTLASAIAVSNPVYPTFIEYAEPTNKMVDGLSDTGLSMRGFLPFGNESERVELTHYAGMATFFDTRVACARPDHDRSDVRIKATFNTTGGMRLSAYGFVDSTVDIPRFNGTSGGNFSCEVVIPQETEQAGIPSFTIEWPVVLCWINNASGALVSNMHATPLSPWQDMQLAGTFGEKYLIINYTTTLSGWESLFQKATSIGSVEAKSVAFEDRAEWAEITMNQTGISLAVSLCYTAAAVQHRRIDTIRQSDRVNEPSATWNLTSVSFNTSSIRRQLDATASPLSQSTRAVFELPDFNSTSSSWVSYAPTGTYIGEGAMPPMLMLSSALLSMALAKEHGASVPMCYGCVSFEGGHINHLQTAVFNQILQDTSSPGKALQALETSFYAQWYYSNLYLFDAAANATVWSNLPVEVPVRKTFLSAVVTAVVVHLVMCAGVTFVFLTGTSHSLLGNAWQVIAQVRGKEIDGLLGNGSLTDREVETRMTVRGLGSVRAWLTEIHGVKKVVRKDD
jgi:hypothetical protein